MTIGDTAQVVSAAISSFALIIAAIAAFIAFLQIKSNDRIARENIAVDTHRQLLYLCIDRPELSSSLSMLKYLGRENFKGIVEEVTSESERVLWFLSYVLNAMEQIIETNPDDAAWRTTMAAQVDYHRELLQEVWAVWADHYSLELRRFVADQLAEE